MQLLSLLKARPFKSAPRGDDLVDTSWRLSRDEKARLTAHGQDAQSVLFRARSVSRSICLLSLDGRSILLRAESVRMPGTEGGSLSEEDMRLRVELKDWLRAMDFIESASDGEITALLDPLPPPPPAPAAPSETDSSYSAVEFEFDPRTLPRTPPSPSLPPSSKHFAVPPPPVFQANTYQGRASTLPPAAHDAVRREVRQMTSHSRLPIPAWLTAARRRRSGSVDTVRASSQQADTVRAPSQQAQRVEEPSEEVTEDGVRRVKLEDGGDDWRHGVPFPSSETPTPSMVDARAPTEETHTEVPADGRYVADMLDAFFVETSAALSDECPQDSAVMLPARGRSTSPRPRKLVKKESLHSWRRIVLTHPSGTSIIPMSPDPAQAAVRT